MHQLPRLPTTLTLLIIQAANTLTFGMSTQKLELRGKEPTTKL